MAPDGYLRKAGTHALLASANAGSASWHPCRVSLAIAASARRSTDLQWRRILAGTSNFQIECRKPCGGARSTAAPPSRTIQPAESQRRLDIRMRWSQITRQIQTLPSIWKVSLQRLRCRFRCPASKRPLSRRPHSCPSLCTFCTLSPSASASPEALFVISVFVTVSATVRSKSRRPLPRCALRRNNSSGIPASRS